MQSLITSFLSTLIVLFAINQLVHSAPVLNLNGLDLSLLKLGNVTPGSMVPSNTIGATPGGVLIPALDPIRNPIVLPAAGNTNLANGVLIPAPNPIRNPNTLPASSGPGSANGNLEPGSIPQQSDVAVANLNYIFGLN